MKSAIAPLLVTIALAGISSNANGATTVYTTQAGFLAAVSNPGLQTFDTLALGSVASPLAFSAGSWNFVASTSNGTDFYQVGSVSDVWLSTNTAGVGVQIAPGAGVYGVGGFFFTTDLAGSASGGNVTLTTSDLTSYTIIGSNTGSFVGFVSDSPITSLSVQVAAEQWATVNNLTLGGQLAVVPEPGMAMVQLLMGLSGVCLVGARRRRIP